MKFLRIAQGTQHFPPQCTLRLVETGEVVQVTRVAQQNYTAWGYDEEGRFGVVEMWSETDGVREYTVGGPA